MCVFCYILFRDTTLLQSLHFFYKNQLNWTLGLLSLNFWWSLGYIVLNLFLFFSDFFLIFRYTVMIYNYRNRSNDTAESQKGKKRFDAHFSEQSVKNHGSE